MFGDIIQAFDVFFSYVLTEIELLQPSYYRRTEYQRYQESRKTRHSHPECQVFEDVKSGPVISE
jgi:hypothetical protein